MKKNIYLDGLKDGIPIALGYLAVSFSFGILAVKSGLSVFQSSLISGTNFASAGQFAGLQIIIVSGTIIEMVLTELIVNLRYALMSISLSQKLDPNMSILKKCVIAFLNTDEVFAVAISKNKKLSFTYMVGLQTLPFFGWILGTLFGAIAGNVLPLLLTSALSISLYGMFVAIVLPVAKDSKYVLFTIFIALLLSILFYYLPIFDCISSGMSIIICTIVSSIFGAIFFPVDNEKEGK